MAESSPVEGQDQRPPSVPIETQDRLTLKKNLDLGSSMRVTERTVSSSDWSPVVDAGAPRRYLPGLTSSLFHIGPLTGLAALGCAVVLLFASFAVLQGSKGQTVDKWKTWEPTVWLAVFTAISNKLIAFAAIQGVVVSWWRRAAVGTTLARLHTDWSYGLHAWRALFAGRNFNALALACLCATFVAIDGPLLQRASTVNLIVPNTPMDLTVSVSPELPAYWSGGTIYIEGTVNGSAYAIPSDAFHHLVEEFVASKTISGAVHGCNGTCTGTILAPALATIGCQTSFHYSNFSAPLPPNVARAYNDAFEEGLPVGAPDDRSVFVINPYTVNEMPLEREHLFLQTNISDESVGHTCAGHVNSTICELVSAVAEYPVTINADGSVLVTDTSSLSSPKIVRLANNTALSNKIINEQGLLTSDGWIRTTLSGLSSVANNKWFIDVGLLPNNVTTGGWPVNTHGGQTTWFQIQQTLNYKAFTTSEDCAPIWNDPRDDVMIWLNTLMFYTGVAVAQKYAVNELRPMLDEAAEIHYNVTGYLQTPTNEFGANMNYFAGAAVLQIFSILAILYTFHGWWRLGWRSGSVSFSPLELAKAFDAPLLQDVPCHRNGAAIAKYEGDRKVQYTTTTQSEMYDQEKGPNSSAKKLTFVETKESGFEVDKTRSLGRVYRSLKDTFTKRK